MRIFLDFDGVLRRQDSPRSRLDADCLEQFAAAVLSAPDARVVVSSTWRLVHSFASLRALFPPQLAARIEGATPNLPEAEEFARHDEVLAYLAGRQLRGSPWIAVDDDPEQYRPGVQLVLVDPAAGFDARCGVELRRLLAHSAPIS
jgi:hypothetical protein